MEKISIIVSPESFELLQKHAGGGLFKNPPVYKSGKYFIDVDSEVIQGLNNFRTKNKLKNFDEVIRLIVLEYEQEAN